MMTNPLTLYDLSQVRIEQRAREATAARLANQALSTPPTAQSGFRFRFAMTLRHLANRLEPAPDLAGCAVEASL